MPIDQTASAVNRAKAILMGLDKSNIETPVQTEELRWLLQTLVDLGTYTPRPGSTKPALEGTVGDSAFRAVLGATVAVAEAEKSRGW